MPPPPDLKARPFMFMITSLDSLACTQTLVRTGLHMPLSCSFCLCLSPSPLAPDLDHVSRRSIVFLHRADVDIRARSPPSLAPDSHILCISTSSLPLLCRTQKIPSTAIGLCYYLSILNFLSLGFRIPLVHSWSSSFILRRPSRSATFNPGLWVYVQTASTCTISAQGAPVSFLYLSNLSTRRNELCTDSCLMPVSERYSATSELGCPPRPTIISCLGYARTDAQRHGQI